MNNIPDNANMLFSFVNMKLRDEFESLDELCLSLDIEKEWLTEKLASAGFLYNEDLNKFW